MELKKYLEENKMSLLDLSEISGVSYACLHGLLNKNKTCNVETCFRLVLATRNEVKAEDLINGKKISSIIKSVLNKREKFFNKRRENGTIAASN